MVYFHDTGAVLLFGFGAVYCWLQTILTYKMSLLGTNPVPIFAARLILTCIITVFGSIFFIAEVAAYGAFRHQTEHTVAHWQPDDPGYSIHVLSNIGEWLSAFCFGLFSVTFFDEFQCVNLSLNCKLKPGVGSESTDYLNLEEGNRDDEE
jgi:hypothetical protein